MSVVAERFTNRHVAEDSKLALTAAEYLMQYTGTFDFLLSAKQALRMNGDIGPSLVRGVLNCMLSDPTVTGLIVPPYKTFEVDLPTDEMGSKFSYPSNLEDDPPRQEYPKLVRMKTTWLKQYGISMRSNAVLVHAINQNTSGLYYWPAFRRADTESPFTWKLNWFCNPYLHMALASPKTGNKYADKYTLLTRWEADQMVTGQALFIGLPNRAWKMCAKCQEIGGSN